MAGSSSSSDAGAHYYKFDYAGLPDELFHKDIPLEKWLQTSTTTVDKRGFPANSLNKLEPLDRQVELERICGISLYMATNVLPFALCFLIPLSIYSFIIRQALWGFFAYMGILFVVENYYFKPYFLKQYKQSFKMDPKDVKTNQYLFTERNTCKYLSMNYVWPKSVHRPALAEKPVIFCAVPHGVGPFGIVAYPLWSKVWSDKICHWTTAPVVLKIPLVSYFMRMIGYIP